jgi:protein-disulfide isomerase
MRRYLYPILFGFLLASSGVLCPPPVAAQTQDAVTPKALADDPEAPVIGNPQGDVTIIAFVDYNCTRCKASEPALKQLLAKDGNIRVVYKDWPILAPSSIFGARLALAAKYQGKYEAMHAALMKIPGTGVDNSRMQAAARAAGIDIDRLNKDLDRHSSEIVARIRRNDAEAKAMGFIGTPVYVIGNEIIAGPLDLKGFEKSVVAARHGAAP